MKLQVGKRYVRRDGQVTGPLERNAIGDFQDSHPALEFYADPANYGTAWRKVCEDGGGRAKKALGEEEK